VVESIEPKNPAKCVAMLIASFRGGSRTLDMIEDG